uniref:RNA helicase n=1 Tax=Aureoumbra lagunensis TaxID=44058 RepID=A0A7S3JRZ4_9STRA|mmetsp:Transcript_7965/g.11121  ORF Transcript_7965/g.11121 Transcript_7965/m.11121 type:complete len:660 (-) Transcript_7965:1148-3127(-)
MSYIPPHLRQRQDGVEVPAINQGHMQALAPEYYPPQQQRQSYGVPPQGYGDQRGNSGRYGRGYGGYNGYDQIGYGGFYGGGGGSRGGGRGRYGGDRRSWSGGSGDYGGRYSGNVGGRKNELGFYGDMRPSERLERELFPPKNETQGTGINFSNYDKIPVEMSGEDCPEPYEEFPREILGEAISHNLELCHYTRPTPVQKYALPIGLNGRDMMACAQTGSGKTGGFLFPVLVSLLRDGAISPDGEDIDQSQSYTRKSRARPNALVLAPTRELVSQIFDEARKFCYCTGVRPVVCYGGADTRYQLQELERGADLLVATPGRLVDFLERGRVTLSACRFLVLDEADRMLDMGFEPQIRRIVCQEDMPRTGDRQTFMFSATFPREMQILAGDFLHNYIFLTVGRVGSACKDVTQKFQFVETRDKPDVLMRYLSSLSPEENGLTLVFVETKRDADYLEDLLCNQGFPASSIHGDKSQTDREHALRDFKSGRTPILVGTDVAARGLDIPNVLQVINFDLPRAVSDYVHRIGRTGRAGNTGFAMSFLSDKNRNIVRELIDLLLENGQEVPSWMENMCAYSSGYSGSNSGSGRRSGGGRGYGGRGYGGRDFRKDSRGSGFSKTYTHSNHQGGFRSQRGQGGGSGHHHHQGGGGYQHGGSSAKDNSAW